MRMSQSMEDYLEDILKLSQVRPVVRSVDIATDMNVSKPSVSVAMKKLRENAYVDMDDCGFITLTDAGKEIASRIYERHKLIRKWLVWMGVSERVAEEDACRIEHVLSAETFQAIKEHIRGVVSMEE